MTASESPSQPLQAAPSAASVPTPHQFLRHGLCALALSVFILWDYKIALTVLNLGICLFYVASVCLRLLTALLSLIRNPEIRIEQAALSELSDSDLPTYTVLVPMYREAAVVPALIDALKGLDYPPEKLDVRLLLEHDDEETTAACQSASLPSFCQVVIVPPGSPRTKPRACNVGLSEARGEYLVIYDAEDRPEPDQLKKAVLAFRNLDDESTVCLQAKLNFYNQEQNWLTRFFTLEYTAWFDLFLPGLHDLKVPIPLGGTSNHFKTDVLRQLGGWDAYNVAEDCDLGLRLAMNGCQTLVLDSVTWEEATSSPGNWLRQRSRWVKGYLQTHFVHSECPFNMLRKLGLKGTASFLLTVGGLALMLLLNPIYWLILAAWAVLQWKLIYFDFTDATMQSYTVWSQVSWVFFGLTALLFFANFIFVAINLLACYKRRLWHLLPYALLSPFYWILISLGAWKGALQLITTPFYWEKTEHGHAKVNTLPSHG